MRKMNNFQIFGPTVDQNWEMDNFEFFGPTEDNYCEMGIYHIFGHIVFISQVLIFWVQGYVT